MEDHDLKVPTEEDYKAALVDLNDLLKATFQLSVWLTSLKGDTRKQIAAILFAKINLCGLSITKLLPPDSKILAPENTKEINRERFCDISSVASLCRNLVEASNRLYYFAIEKAAEDEIRMRLKIHEYHAVVAHRTILRFLNRSNDRLQELEDDLRMLRAELQQFREFRTLSKTVKKRILEGRQGEALAQSEIAKRRGLNGSAFKADYKYLSSHIHSDAYSLLDLQLDNKVRGAMTVQIRERLLAMAREATYYFALTLRDMHELFPQFPMTREGSEKLAALINRQQTRAHSDQ